MIRAQFICKKCKKLKKNAKCWANVLAEKEYVIDVDKIHFPYEHISVLSGIEIMRKEFEGLVKERLMLDPTQTQNFIIIYMYIHINRYSNSTL